ncbi:hypothetical protein NQZ68_003862 [Dissostichus eleginoides]|nr:hypothetical protein NQZ68_003862 [Dissostichus eleginoides]
MSRPEEPSLPSARLSATLPPHLPCLKRLGLNVDRPQSAREKSLLSGADGAFNELKPQCSNVFFLREAAGRY